MKRINLGVGSIVAACISASAASSQSAFGHFEVQEKGSRTEVVSYVLGRAKGVVEARTTIIKSDQTGRSRVSQSHTVEVFAGSKTLVGRNVMSLAIEGKINVTLEIWESGRLVGTTVMQAGGED